MKYFTIEEFRGQYNRMDPEQLKLLDKFRSLWGAPVKISNSQYALGRTYGSGFHNWVKHGTIQATDIIPHGMKTKEDFKRAYEAAKTAGAIGIGIYPKWNQGPGMHIDIGNRPNRGVGNPATWSAFPDNNGGQTYLSIERAWD